MIWFDHAIKCDVLKILFENKFWIVIIDSKPLDDVTSQMVSLKKHSLWAANATIHCDELVRVLLLVLGCKQLTFSFKKRELGWNVDFIWTTLSRKKKEIDWQSASIKMRAIQSIQMPYQYQPLEFYGINKIKHMQHANVLKRSGLWMWGEEKYERKRERARDVWGYGLQNLFPMVPFWKSNVKIGIQEYRISYFWKE